MLKFGMSALVALSVLLTGAPEAEDHNDAAQQQGRQPVVVTITVAGGEIYATPDPAHVARGQRIEWVCEAGAFNVEFETEEPFGPQAQRGRGIQGQRGRRNGMIPRAQARLMSYKYDITVTLPDGTVIVKDPEVVIGPGPGEEQAPR